MTIRLLAILVATTLISGCSSLGNSPGNSLGVKAWERDLHARADMQAHAVDTAIDDHIYFSKEATSGGRSFAGGGCGCN